MTEKNVCKENFIRSKTIKLVKMETFAHRKFP